MPPIISSIASISAKGYGSGSTQVSYWIQSMQLATWNLGNASAFAGYATLAPSGNFYVATTNYESNSSGRFKLLKLNKYGAIQYIINMPTTAQSIPYGIDIDSSENVYLSGLYSSTNGILIFKYDSAGTFQWQRLATQGTNNVSGGIIVNKATGTSVYATGGAFSTARRIGGVSYSSSGTLNASFMYGNTTTTGLQGWQITNPYNTSNLYYVGYGTVSADVGMLIKTPTSMASTTWQVSLSKTSTSVLLIDVKSDSSENIWVCGRVGAGATMTSLLAKYNSAGTLSWQRELTRTGGIDFVRLCVDGAGNAYCIGQDNNFAIAYIAKYNTSGTLQWTRQMSTSGQSMRPSGIDCNNSAAWGYGQAATYITITFAYIPATGAYRIVQLQVPSNGNGTGNYTLNSVAYVYSTPSGITDGAGTTTAGTTSYTYTGSVYSDSTPTTTPAALTTNNYLTTFWA